MAQTLSIGYGGWVLFLDDSTDAEVFVRFGDREGRLVPMETFIVSDSGVTGNLLRKVPLGLIEAWVNDDEDTADYVRKTLQIPGPDLRRAASYFGTSFGRRYYEKEKPHWVARMLASQMEGSDEEVPPMHRNRRKASSPTTPNPRLEIPPGRPYGEDFYRQVAVAYRALAQHTRAPAATLADANSVPVSSVHRWIRAARGLGLLPPGHKGKVG